MIRIYLSFSIAFYYYCCSEISVVVAATDATSSTPPPRWSRPDGYACSEGVNQASIPPCSGTCPGDSDCYDYIIVGLGAGGAVVAGSFGLACDREVLAFDLGQSQENNELVTVPLFYYLNWVPYYPYIIPYRTSPQPQCLNLTKNYLRGASWGGSSTINAEIMNRGTYQDFQDWADIVGNNTWNFTNVLPYFKQVENNLYLNDTHYHGYSGFLKVSRINQKGPQQLENSWFDPNDNIVFSALNALGIPFRKDLNGDPAQENGWSYGQESVGFSSPNNFGYRSWVGQDLLLPALSCSKLIIKSNTLVTKILFDGTRAIGVQYLENVGTSNATLNGFKFPPNPAYKEAYAKFGVIISGGSFNTPQLLKLSGIGPRAELEKFGIPVVVDAPGVGENLQDQPEFSADYVFKNRSVVDKQGCVTDEPSCNATNFPFNRFYGTNIIAGILDWELDAHSQSQCHAMFGADEAIGSFDYFPPVVPGIFGWLVEVENALSRGTVTLASADPSQYPIINPNYFAHPADFVKMKKCWNLISRIMSHPSVVSQIEGLYFPPAYQVSTEEGIESYLRNITWGHHAAGTARMGRSCDAQAVLDDHLRVYKTRNLYVMDASSFPKLTRGNPTFDVYMLANKGYQLLRASESTIPCVPPPQK